MQRGERALLITRAYNKMTENYNNSKNLDNNTFSVNDLLINENNIISKTGGDGDNFLSKFSGKKGGV